MADDSGDSPSRAARPKGRGWIVFAAAIVLPPSLVVAAGWALWVNRLPVAQWALAAGMERAGIAAVTARVERVETDGIRLTDFRLGDAITADALEVTYTPETLLQSRVVAATVRGLRLTATLDDKGLTISGLETEPSAGAPVPPFLPALPFDELRVVDALLLIHTQAGSIRAPMNLNMSIEPAGEMFFDITAEPGHEAGAGRVNVSGAIVTDTTGAVELAAQFDATGAVRLANVVGAVPVMLQGEAQLNFDRSFTLQHIDITAVSLALEPITVAGVTWELDRLTARVSGTTDAFRGVLGVSGSASGVPAPGVTVASLDFGVESQFEFAGGTLTLSPLPGGGVMVRGVDIAGGLHIEGPTNISLADAPGSVTFDTRNGAIGYELSLAPIEAVMALQLPGAGDVQATLRLPNISVAGTGQDHGLRLRGAALDVLDPPISAQGVDIDVDVGPQATSLDLSIDRLRHVADPPLAQPAALSLAATLANGIIDFAGDATVPPSPLKLSAHGRHDLAAGKGDVEFALDRIDFIPGIVDAATLFPALAGTLRDVQGALTMSGQANWDDTGLRTSLDLDLDALALGLPAGRVSGLTGTLAIEGPTPVTTPPGQRLRGALTAGPLQSAPFKVAFQLRPDNRLVLETLTLEFADGRVAMHDVVYDPANPSVEATLAVDAVDLAGLLDLIQVEGLSGSGRLSGVIPLSIDEGKVAVRQGRLEAAGPGRLSYTGSALADQLGDRGDAVGLTMQALSDFHYESLSLELDKSAAGTGNILLRMQGANPAVLDGYPFAFNINLEGDFDRIAALALEGYATLDDILRWAGGISPN